MRIRTARDLISSSLRLIGVLASGEVPSNSESSDALVSLNEMLDSWSTERLFINAITREPFPLTVSKRTYTMGPGGDFDTVRPIRITGAVLRYIRNENTDIPVRILNSRQWSKIVDKDTDSSIPTYMYPEGTFPLETLNFWPIPESVNDIIIYSIKSLAQFDDLDAELSFPPGYSRALRYNLALELADEYGRPIPPRVMETARDSIAKIKRVNMKPHYIDANPFSDKDTYFDWRTGDLT